MKRIMLCVLSLFAFSTLANAQTPQTLTHSVGLTAEVPKACFFDSGPTAGGLNFSVSSGTNSTFTVQIDPASARVIPSSDTLTFANAFCNTASTIALSRTGLKTTGTATPDFGASINYGANVSWGGEMLGLDPGGPNANSDALGPITGTLSLEIDVPADDGRLLPGDYFDTLVLTVTPNS
jgi:hypothetical protein